MLLKKIEIHGFKSFADKTEFEIGAGVTCLVGPNGCGKSNVVDALKWALGEQRASALRGDAMGDVIFKGNGNRPAMAFAEVTLVFDNEQGELAVETPEVAITRRLYRTGESEYLINRQPCRLKDIKEAFVDTGLGANAYAVLEQGRIDAVLQANPVERRALFEEAAGIQRFRLRKREAARKLEKVDQNLLRVADLVDELEKRERSLKIQAGRARSYVQLTGRHTELKTTQFLASGAMLAAQAGDLDRRLAEAKAGDEAAETALAAAVAQVEEREADAQERRDEVAVLRGRQGEARAEAQSKEQQVATARQHESEARRALHLREQRIAELQEEIARRRRDVEEQEALLERLARELAAGESSAEERRAALAAAQAQDDARARELGQLQRDAQARAGDEMRLSNELTALDTRARGLRVARERLVRREAELCGLLEKVRVDASLVEECLSKLGAQAREQVQSLESARDGLRERRDREIELRRQIGNLQAAIAGKAARRETLAAVIEKMEGVDEGTRRLIRASRDPNSGLRGVRGLLAELLPAPREKARAFDAALGHLAGAVVVSDASSLATCLEHLRRDGGGAATFLVLDRAAPAQSDAAGPGEPLLTGAEVPPELAPLVEAVLGSARLVASEQALLESLGSGHFVVTGDGMRIDRSGAVADRPQKRALGFVERKVERDQLALEVEQQEQELRGLQEEEARVSGEVAQWSALVEESERRKHEVEAGIVESRSEGERLRDRAAIFRRELKVSALERSDLEREERDTSASRATSAAALAEVVRLRDEIEARTRAVALERDAAGEELARLAESEAAAAREVVRLHERVRGVKSELSVLQRTLGEQVSGVEHMVAECGELSAQAERACGEAAAAASRLEQLAGESAALESSIAAAEAAAESSRSAATAARESAQDASQARHDAREALHRLELEQREIELNQTALRTRAREEISLDIDASLPAFDATAAPPIAELTAELAELRDKIARIGNVNLDAIHELEEVEQRLTFLKREKDDLDAARKSLDETIRELDAISREQFVKTFEVVREHFRVLFRKLFHGGKADIQLQEGQDVLEAGIDITAGPPGKDMRSITLLSGGERTMTAVGLLFSLFKAKPAPVAVLDEVDAALDEANIERFCGLLAEFLGSSQFLIVTHSKRTMSYADVIFGVTMQENGVSKRIGIRLEDYEEGGPKSQGRVA